MSKKQRCIIRFLLIFLLAFAVPVPSGHTTITVQAATAKKPSFSVSKKVLYAGYKTFNLKIKNLAKKATVTYKSSNTKVAKVNKKGKVTPISEGSATITATVKQSGKKYTIKTKIVVKEPFITILDRTSYLKVGEKFTFRADVTGMEDEISWSVSDESIATINSTTGEFTAIATGKVTITAKAGNKKQTCDVQIQTTEISNTIPTNQTELSAREIYEKCSPATVEIVASLSNGTSQGSGFFISSGMVVTNYHVIDGANKIEVSTYAGAKYTVEKILGYDKDIDIAILSVPSSNAVLTRNQNGVYVGEKVYALGSPLGLTGTLTDGIVSAASRINDGVDYIQITAAISSGNSGGPLLNSYGEVMGINTMTIVEGQNLNFAINIKEIDRINTNSPISVSDFSKTSKTTKTRSNVTGDDYIAEDTSKSRKTSTCQQIFSEDVVIGQLTPNSMLDYYYFKMDKRAQFKAVLISNNNVTDLYNTYFVVVDSNEEIVLSSYLADDLSYAYIDGYLKAGKYYIVVFPSEDYMNKYTDYAFSIMY